VVQFECGTRILRVIHGRDARATHQTAILSWMPFRPAVRCCFRTGSIPG